MQLDNLVKITITTEYRDGTAADGGASFTYDVDAAAARVMWRLHSQKVRSVRVRVRAVGDRTRVDKIITIERIFTPYDIARGGNIRERIKALIEAVEHERIRSFGLEPDKPDPRVSGGSPEGFDNLQRRAFRDRAGEAEPLQVWEEASNGTRYHYDVRTPKARSAAMRSVHASSQYRAVELHTNRGGRLTVNRGATKAAIHSWLVKQTMLPKGTVVSIGQRDRAAMSDAIRCAHERINELEKWREDMTNTTRAALDELRDKVAGNSSAIRQRCRVIEETVDVAHREIKALAARVVSLEQTRAMRDELRARVERVAAATVGSNFIPDAFAPDKGGNLRQQIAAVREHLGLHRRRIERLEQTRVTLDMSGKPVRG